MKTKLSKMMYENTKETCPHGPFLEVERPLERNKGKILLVGILYVCMPQRVYDYEIIMEINSA